MKTAILVAIILPLFTLAQPVLKPTIGLHNAPQLADAICSIPVFQGNMDSSGYAAGDTAADFTLYKTNGDSVGLRDLLLSGKPVLLVNGNYTCPVWRGKIDDLNSMVNHYGNQLQVFVVYTVEAHPVTDVSPYSGLVWTTSANQQEGVLFPQPDTYGKRLQIIDSMRAHYNLVPEILVDGPCNEWWSNYGPAPNNAYLIDTTGIIKAKHGWFNRAPDNMWCSIDSLLGTTSGNCIYAGSNGSFSVTLDADSIAYGIADEVLAVHTTIHNLSATDNVALEIKKQTINIPAGWETALCADICYSTTVSTTDVTIAPADSMPFIFYFYSGPNADTGKAKVRITNLNNPNNVIEQRFLGITSNALSVNATVRSESPFTFLPNPFIEHITVKFTEQQTPREIELLDESGRLLQKHTATGTCTLQTQHLPKGIYILKLGNSSVKVLKN